MERKSPGSKKPSTPLSPYLFRRPLRKEPTNTGPTSPGSIPALLSPIHHNPDQNQEQQLGQHQRSTPPLPPTWPAPPMNFSQFGQLPAEVRQMIWALYLAASPRIHVVHETGHAAPPPPPVPLQRAPRSPDDVQVHRLPLYHIATLDASTNGRCRGLRSPNVNVECRDVARRLGMLGSSHSSGPFGKKAAFWLARDLQISGSERRRPPPAPSPQLQQQRRRRQRQQQQQQQQQLGPSASRTLTTTTHRGEETKQQRRQQELFRPVHVDWAEDLIYICSASNEQGFCNLAETPWASQIQRLAVLVPRRCESNHHNNTNNNDGNGMMPFGAGYRVAQVLRPMVSLRELYVVMIPLVRPAPRPTGPGNSCWGRDCYGFVNYVDYLREVGISGSSGSTATNQKGTMRQECHLTYQRTALSMVQALAGRLDSARVKVRKVVDVDCKLFTESAYERRTRWTGIKPSKD